LFENDFQKIIKLGEGNYGEVWLAKKNVDGKEYAVKIFKGTNIFSIT
jgi:serine/threonine protein kinase